MIAVTETLLKINDDDLDSFHIDDYDDMHSCRPNRGGGGVALYINRLLQSKPLPLLPQCILNRAEVICTEIIIPYGKNIVVASSIALQILICQFKMIILNIFLTNVKTKKSSCVAILMWIY